MRLAFRLFLLSMLLIGCAESPRAPVEQRRGVTGQQPAPTRYTVVKGDTLYSIAWRYGIDYRELARINRIDKSYTIYPGQVIALKGSTAKAVPVAKTAPRKKTPAAETVTKPSPPRANNTGPADNGAPVSTWAWPTSGKVVRGFSGTVHKGIDIDGKAGDPVRATAAGQVVYAGSGIVGYGNLVIVKHNDIYLSAYAHNRRLLVAEGQKVNAGERIAEKGSSGTNKVKLHFEIRREGKPVDPKRLLPSR